MDENTSVKFLAAEDEPMEGCGVCCASSVDESIDYVPCVADVTILCLEESVVGVSRTNGLYSQNDRCSTLDTDHTTSDSSYWMRS